MRYLLLLVLLTGCFSTPDFEFKAGKCARDGNKTTVLILDRFVNAFGEGYYYVAVSNPLHTFDTTFKRMIPKAYFESVYTQVSCP